MAETKPGDVAVIVVGHRVIPVTVIEVMGDTFKVRLGSNPRSDHSPALPSRKQLDRREQLVEAA